LLHKAMDVLRLFTPSRKEIGVTEAAALLRRPKSTMSRWLSALEDAEFLERSSDSGLYRVSMRLAAVGEMTRQATSLQRTSRHALEQLTSATGETSNLVLLVGPEGVNVESVDSPHPILHMGAVGRRFPPHASAAGKALIAWLPEDALLALLPSRLEACTSLTITSHEQLRAELATVRDRGYAVNYLELESELVGVGAPVRDHRGAVVAAISMSAPVSRMPREAVPAAGEHVVRAACTLSRDLGWSPN
jgi:DNA-binding IclR family transcriptional regulator